MSDHLPECLLRSPRDLKPESDCICDRLRAAEQRVTERHNAEHEDDRLAAFQNGYDAATVKERQRSVLLIADAYGKALSAARDAVAAECIAHHGYTPGQTCPYCTDALAAIDGVTPDA